MDKKQKLLLWVMLLVFWVPGGPVNATESENLLQIHVDPQAVHLGTLYNGIQMTVRGQAPENNDIVIRFIGDPQDIRLNRKGKILGALWMSTGTVTIKHVPDASLIYSTRDFKAMAGPFSSEKSDAWKLGHLALQQQMKIDPPSGDKNFLTGEFVRLKEEEYLYSEIPGGVKITGHENGRESFEACIRIPSSIRPGNYQVEAYAFQNGNLTDKVAQPVRAKIVGLPRFMSTMAFQHGLTYGILATIIAIAGGLLMGLIFSPKKGAH